MTHSQQICFVLNGQMARVDPTDTHQTLLQFLRAHPDLTGTKEGCAEGDCGACTIVIGQLDGAEVQYRALNACILLLAQVDGREVITVEGLQDKSGQLHPVQQALVDFHGSQCGFCTPGFVMSLYAHYRNQLPADRQSLKNTLAGNLCRCTGYGPILAAGQAMYGYEAPEQIDTVSLLREIQKQKPLQLDAPGIDPTQTEQLFAPTSEDELQDLMHAHPDAVLWAGGTDTGLWVTKRLSRLPCVILLHKIESLNFMRETPDGYHIGAMTRYSQLTQQITEKWPDFGEVIRRTGSTQIRNAGTLGGNIANGSPIGDMPPILISLGATLVLRKKGSDREIPIEDFFIEYSKQDLRAGEYVQAIKIPNSAAQSQFTSWKISKRFDQDISAVLGAFCLTRDRDKITDVRIAFGGMAAIPKRASACEKALLHTNGDATALAKATKALAEDFTPMADMRASDQYRMQVAQSLLHKALISDSPVYLGKSGGAA
ncbi:MAG: xanthine dehydrogenase small subunit [Robiginitomaculum sp.]|nr:MAG: xanthine dehydrogenase small subunit [Robiginitomaculum sp.]